MDTKINLTGKELEMIRFLLYFGRQIGYGQVIINFHNNEPQEIERIKDKTLLTGRLKSDKEITEIFQQVIITSQI